MVICSLDALKKFLKKKETSIKKETVDVLQQRNRYDENGFDLVFVGYNNTDFNFIFCYYWLFSKSQFIYRKNQFSEI